MMTERLTVLLDEGANGEARAWTARFLMRIAGMPFRVAFLAAGSRPPDGPTVYYGRREDIKGIRIAQSHLFDGDLASKLAMPRTPSGEVAGTPVLFGGSAISRMEGATAIAGDVFASVFALATRLEERGSAEHDEHGRFRASQSFLGANGLLERPILDEYAEMIAAEIAQLYPGVERRTPWPGGRRFVVCVTHDIETLQQPTRLGYMKWKAISATRNAMRGRPAQAARDAAAGVARAITGMNPSWSFERLRERVRPWPATIYFFGKATCAKDGSYDVMNGDVRREIAALRREGCEIGVHLGYETGADSVSMKGQKIEVDKAAGESTAGARYHYLRARWPDAWPALERAGFEYDASLGFAEAPGFRAGTSFPYRPFDVRETRELDIYEVPLVAMDGTFLQYMGLAPDEATARINSLAETVSRAGGVFTLLWHNTMVDPFDKPDAARVYTEVTVALSAMPAWGATVGECVRAWRGHCARLEAGDE